MFIEIKSQNDFTEAIMCKNVVIMIGYFGIMFGQVIEDKGVLRLIDYLLETNEETITDVKPIPSFNEIYNDFIEETIMYGYSGDKLINQWKEILDDFKDDRVLNNCTSIVKALESKKVSNSIYS